jgi:formylglycine-generating enzyme required for sulfatase activity
MHPDAVTHGMNLLAQALNCLTNLVTRLEYDRKRGGPSSTKVVEPPASKPVSKSTKRLKVKPRATTVRTAQPAKTIVYSLDDATPRQPAPVDPRPKKRRFLWFNLFLGVGCLVFLASCWIFEEFTNQPPEAQQPKPGDEQEFDVGHGVKMTFCWIPPSNGKIALGLSNSEQEHVEKTFYKGEHPNWLNREREHEIEGLDGFWMAKTEMTQGQYAAISGKKNPSFFSKEGEGKNLVPANTDDFPVENVTWYDAESCIENMAVPAGLKGWRFDLPSEAQWEFACRGGNSGVIYYWGNELNGELANCNWSNAVGSWGGKGEFHKRTTAVGAYDAKAKHPWGLVDMSGNVLEWCADYFGSYDKLPKKRNPMQLQQQQGDIRVIRGGAWDYTPDNCRTTFRSSLAADFPENSVGFRVVLVP